MSKFGASDGPDGKRVVAIAMERHNVSMHLPSRVQVTAGTIIGVTEINGQEPLFNITEDALMATNRWTMFLLWIANLLNQTKSLGSKLFHLRTN